MDGMKRLVVGIAFTATLALTLVASGSDAYAGSGKGPTPTTAGQAAPKIGGLLESLGVTWE